MSVRDEKTFCLFVRLDFPPSDKERGGAEKKRTAICVFSCPDMSDVIGTTIWMQLCQEDPAGATRDIQF